MTRAHGRPGLVGRLDGFQRCHSWIGLPLAAIYKFFDDRGAYLAALITYYGFVSLFPLLLLLLTILRSSRRSPTGWSSRARTSASTACTRAASGTKGYQRIDASFERDTAGDRSTEPDG